MKSILICLGALLHAPMALSAGADLKLAAIFADHMVLQRDKPVAVWGWADPGESVTVRFAGQSKTTTAGTGGGWSLKLDALKAASEAKNTRLKELIEKRQELVQSIKEGEVTPDSDEFRDIETRVFQIESYTKTFRTAAQRELQIGEKLVTETVAPIAIPQRGIIGLFDRFRQQTNNHGVVRPVRRSSSECRM